MIIQPYNRDSWEAVLSAFRHFLDNRLQYSRKHREQADNELKQRMEAMAERDRIFKSLNPHLVSSAYTKTGIRLLARHDDSLPVAA